MCDFQQFTKCLKFWKKGMIYKNMDKRLLEFIHYVCSIDNDSITNVQKEYLNKMFIEVKDVFSKFREVIRSMTNNSEEFNITIYLLSILFFYIDDKEVIMKEIIQHCIENDISLNKLFFVQNQLNAQTIPLNKCYLDKIRFCNYTTEKLKQYLKIPQSYIPLKKRNKDRIVIITEQLLGLGHAPTRLVLECCYYMTKTMKKEILLIVSNSNDIDDDICWYKKSTKNVIEEYLKNEFLLLRYKDSEFYFWGARMNEDTMGWYQNIVEFIYKFNPSFVLEIGCSVFWADILKCFTTVVASNLIIDPPISNAQIICYYDGFDLENNSDIIHYIEGNRQNILISSIKPKLEEKITSYEKENFGISKDSFVIAIVGNRLNEEINKKFIDNLKKIVMLNDKIVFIIIGHYIGNGFREPIFEKKVFLLGYQNDLAGVIEIADLYLNLPRQGGGWSSLMALRAGVPVITLDKNDVAANVGESFICKDEVDIINTVKRYLEDDSFNKEQKQHAINRFECIEQKDLGLNELLNNIEDLIVQRENARLD